MQDVTLTHSLFVFVTRKESLGINILCDVDDRKQDDRHIAEHGVIQILYQMSPAAQCGFSTVESRDC